MKKQAVNQSQSSNDSLSKSGDLNQQGKDEKFSASRCTKEFLHELQDCSAQLVDRLQNDNFFEASELINRLTKTRDQHFFNSVGQMTRGLHDAIVNFHVDVDNGDESLSEMRDASDRLHYVIKLTQDAAEKTMDKVDAVTPIAAKLGTEAKTLKNEWVRLKNRELSKEDFAKLYIRVDAFLDQMDDGTTLLNKSLQDIMLEQGYQDLTGQVIKRVIGLVTNVEDELVTLMRIAGQVEQMTGVAVDKVKNKVDTLAGEGPQIHADKRSDVMSGQDDVDDLLSSLGF